MVARSYNSSLRDEQARLTRRRIVTAAIELFMANGYAATTMDAIAERAGVGRKTVFSSVGGKAAVLKLAFDTTLAGDDEPLPIADRPAWKEAMGREDAVEVLDEWIAMNAAVAQRVAPLHHVVVIAADADADAAALLADTDRQRDEGARVLIQRLVDLGALRTGIDLDHAVAIADMLIDPCLYCRLAVTHAWPVEHYTAYLKQIAIASLIDHRQQPTPPELTGQRRDRRRSPTPRR
jgi:AcrR family transcriptional regulator